MDQNKYDQAESLYLRSLRLKEKTRGLVGLDATVVANLAKLYFLQHRYAESEPLFRRAAAIFEASLGPNHPDLAQTLNAYSQLLRKIKRKREASAMSARAKEILVRNPGYRSGNHTVDVSDLKPN
jgi:tetratricopeptide (TPR) repeat protein